MKVKYEGTKYTVLFSDAIFIWKKRALLFAKRQKRRLKLVFTKQNALLYGIITFLWTVFAATTYIVAQFRAEPYSVVDAIWNIKEDYFTSVILALLTSGFATLFSHHKRMLNQHYTYTESMHDFEKMIDIYIGENSWHYISFYTDECYQTTIEYLEKHIHTSNIVITPDILEIIDQVIERLRKLEEENKRGNILYLDSCDILDWEIGGTINLLQKYKKRTHIERNVYFEIIRDLYFITKRLRRPWRFDSEIKKEILERLSHYTQNEISDHFYYNLLLNGYELVEIKRKAKVRKKRR